VRRDCDAANGGHLPVVAGVAKPEIDLLKKPLRVLSGNE
jgi:hypothetical protein